VTADVHEIFSRFKQEYPEIYALEEELGRRIHHDGGPLDERTRWLVKLAMSAAAGRHRALETHIVKARAAGVQEQDIRHALLLLIPTVGFPAFMEAYQVYAALRAE
jgi:alkylhydroperoxidase/carboxymuconolactone decarboxylase family protein YurZ